MELYGRERNRDVDELTFSDKLDLLREYRSHWGANLKMRATAERLRVLTTAANKRRSKSNAVSKRRKRRKLNKGTR